MNEIQKMAIRTSLRRMFKDNYFSICTIDNCLKLSGIIIDPGDYQTMKTLHCTNYSEMPEQLRDWLLKTVSNAFGAVEMSEVEYEAKKASPPPAVVQQTVGFTEREGRKSWMQKLLG